MNSTVKGSLPSLEFFREVNRTFPHTREIIELIDLKNNLFKAIPVIARIFEEMDIQISFLTHIVLKVSETICKFWLVYIIFALLFIVLGLSCDTKSRLYFILKLLTIVLSIWIILTAIACTFCVPIAQFALVCPMRIRDKNKQPEPA